MKKKRCNRCGDKKSPEEFRIGRVRKDGSIYRKASCKECMNEVARLRYQKKANAMMQYEVISCPDDEYSGFLKTTGFAESLEMGYFIPGMVIQKYNGSKFVVVGEELTKQRLERI